MERTGFRFKQFTVQHSHSSMKVGTDAVLLGAWAMCSDEGRALDIGTGCGVIALMMAQRFSKVEVLGIDIDKASIDEATCNAQAANMTDKVSFRIDDVRLMDNNSQFGCIVCNPPFFTEDTLSPDNRRSNARNTTALSFPELIAAVSRLLTYEGIFSVILPAKETDSFIVECHCQGLYLKRRCDVRTTPRKEPKRTLLTFARSRGEMIEREAITLMNADGSRSEQYMHLARDFYL